MSYYVVTHLHEYGASSYVVTSDELPTVKQIVRELDINFEPSKSETIEIDTLSEEGYKYPQHLSRQEGDDEEFEEFEDL